MKALPPSLRGNSRYLAFEVTCGESGIRKQELVKELWRSASSLYGDVGTSRCGLWLIEFDGKGGIIKCAHDMVNEVKIILATINMINGKAAGLRVLRTSGTIKGARETFIDN